MSAAATMLDVRDLRVDYRIRGGGLFGARTAFTAVDGVSFHVATGEALAVVGESGSGKTTIARAICGLVDHQGAVLLDGRDITRVRGRERRELAPRLQMVAQNPLSSLDPLRSVEDSIAEPLDVHLTLGKEERSTRVAELLELVDLPTDLASAPPRKLSGGQRQRVAIARAIALDPSVLVCDEPVSSLDVTTQTHVVRLLKRLVTDLGISCVFITHDLALVPEIASRVAVVYFGKIVETGTTGEVFAAPKHPYTRMLLDAVPVPNPFVQRSRDRGRLAAEPLNTLERPSGCPFHPRCPHAFAPCSEVVPVDRVVDGRTVACHLGDDDLLATSLPVDPSPEAVLTAALPPSPAAAMVATAASGRGVPKLLRLLGNKLIPTIGVMFVVSLGAFLLQHIAPGDPAVAASGEFASPEQLAATRHELGLDRPLVIRYARWLGDAVRGDLGDSWSVYADQPVTQLIRERFGATVSLTIAAMIVAVIVAVILGSLAALYEGRRVDRAITALTSTGMAMPTFFLGLLLIYLFSVRWRWLPAIGYASIFEDPLEWLRHMTLPAIALGLSSGAALARQLRASLTRTMRTDYIRAAYAKGLSPMLIFTRHGIKNAALPVVTLLGLQMIGLLGGSVVIESLFALPGIGRMTISAVLGRDIPIVQGVILLFGLIAVIVNITVDATYVYLNPRLRSSQGQDGAS